MSYTREKVLFIFDKFPFIEVYKDNDNNQRIFPIFFFHNK